MVVSSLTSSKYWDISENYLKWTLLRPSKQTFAEAKRIYGCIYNSTSDRLLTAIAMNNLKLIILDYLAAKKSGILYWHGDICAWSISSHSVWKVIPSRHLTEYNTLRNNALHRNTQHWSIDWNPGAAAYLERYVHYDMRCPCVTQIVSAIGRMFHAVAVVVIIILYAHCWSWARLSCVWKLPNLS